MVTHTHTHTRVHVQCPVTSMSVCCTRQQRTRATSSVRCTIILSFNKIAVHACYKYVYESEYEQTRTTTARTVLQAQCVMQKYIMTRASVHHNDWCSIYASRVLLQRYGKCRRFSTFLCENTVYLQTRRQVYG